MSLYDLVSKMYMELATNHGTPGDVCVEIVRASRLASHASAVEALGICRLPTNSNSQHHLQLILSCSASYTVKVAMTLLLVRRHSSILPTAFNPDNVDAQLASKVDIFGHANWLTLLIPAVVGAIACLQAVVAAHYNWLPVSGWYIDEAWVARAWMVAPTLAGCL